MTGNLPSLWRLWGDEFNALHEFTETDIAEAHRHVMEWMHETGHTELNYTIDAEPTNLNWRTRSSGRVSAIPGKPLKWWSNHELIEKLLHATNPILPPLPTWCGCGACNMDGDVAYTREQGYLGPK